MTDQIVLTVPDDISERARQIANDTAQSAEQVLIDFLKTMPSSVQLPPNVQVELEALSHLSDDALWTIAREQLPADVQSRASALMDKNSQALITSEEHLELAALVERADRLIVRKAEAGALLRKRGYAFRSEDYRALHD